VCQPSKYWQQLRRTCRFDSQDRLPHWANTAGFNGLVAPLPVGSPTLPQPDFPGINAIAAGAGEGLDPNFRPSVNYQFDLTIQRQISNKVSVEVGYIGRKITHEFQPIQVNAVPYMMTIGDSGSTKLTARWFGNIAAAMPDWWRRLR